MKYHLIILGCQMNISDGERVKAVMEQMGYEYTPNEDEANILGMIACSVRQKPIDKVYSKIGQWNKWKNRKNLITFVSGCVLPSDREKFLKLFDFVFPMSELSQFPEMLKSYGIVSPQSLKLAEPNMPDNQNIFQLWNVKPKYSNKFEAFVPIQNGCDKFCTFCAVPYTRGREVSRPSNEIVEEVKSLIDQGYKSITLLGQNVNSYGLDKKGEEVTFAQLLDKIGQYGNQSGKQFWTYFTSPHPHDMTRDVIETIAKYDCLAKQIHLPMQSGDEKMLIKMNRRHSMQKYRDIVNDIRTLLPEATLFTDIIVGFTGETDEQFHNTMLAMDEFKFNMAYIAMYSPRPGAASYRWEDTVDQAVKKERFHTLSDKLGAVSFVHNKQLVGKTVSVLITGNDRKTGNSNGLTEGKLIIRLNKKDSSLLGQIVKVKVTQASPLSLEGELAEVTEEVIL